MNLSLPGVVLCLSLFCATGMGQSAPCTVTNHTEYTKKIKEFTTEPVFSTDLVDHLPSSSCVPAPDCAGHSVTYIARCAVKTKEQRVKIKGSPARTCSTHF
jgi:hypothetical protein